MNGCKRLLLLAALSAVSLLILCGPAVSGSVQKSRQKLTMAAMVRAAHALEAGNHAVAAATLDAWKHPFRLRLRENHYSLPSAGADGRFETAEPRGPTAGFEADIVLVSGGFAQYPEGV